MEGLDHTSDKITGDNPLPHYIKYLYFISQFQRYRVELDLYNLPFTNALLKINKSRAGNKINFANLIRTKKYI